MWTTSKLISSSADFPSMNESVTRRIVRLGGERHARTPRPSPPSRTSCRAAHRSAKTKGHAAHARRSEDPRIGRRARLAHAKRAGRSAVAPPSVPHSGGASSPPISLRRPPRGRHSGQPSTQLPLADGEDTREVGGVLPPVEGAARRRLDSRPVEVSIGHQLGGSARPGQALPRVGRLVRSSPPPASAERTWTVVHLGWLVSPPLTALRATVTVRAQGRRRPTRAAAYGSVTSFVLPGVVPTPGGTRAPRSS